MQNEQSLQSRISTFPHLIEAKIHQRRDANYILGSTFLTLIVGGSVFLVALSWADVAQLSFERKECQEGDVKKAAIYALFITLVAIILMFLAMFYIPGTKW